jgi:flagellar biosynthesis protein FliR
LKLCLAAAKLFSYFFFAPFASLANVNAGINFNLALLLSAELTHVAI